MKVELDKVYNGDDDVIVAKLELILESDKKGSNLKLAINPKVDKLTDLLFNKFKENDVFICLKGNTMFVDINNEKYTVDGFKEEISHLIQNFNKI